MAKDTLLLCTSLTFELVDIVSDVLVVMFLANTACDRLKDTYFIWYCLFMGQTPPRASCPSVIYNIYMGVFLARPPLFVC